MELSSIFSTLLFILAIIACFIGINTYNSCGGSANKDIRTQKNYAFLQAIATGTSVMAIYNILNVVTADNSKWPNLFLLMMVCISAITTSSMGKEIQNKLCTKDETSTDSRWLTTIIIVSLIVFFITFFLYFEEARKSLKNLNRTELAQGANKLAKGVSSVSEGVTSRAGGLLKKTNQIPINMSGATPA